MHESAFSLEEFNQLVSSALDVATVPQPLFSVSLPPAAPSPTPSPVQGRRRSFDANSQDIDNDNKHIVDNQGQSLVQALSENGHPCSEEGTVYFDCEDSGAQSPIHRIDRQVNRSPPHTSFTMPTNNALGDPVYPPTPSRPPILHSCFSPPSPRTATTKGNRFLNTIRTFLPKHKIAPPPGDTNSPTTTATALSPTNHSPDCVPKALSAPGAPLQSHMSFLDLCDSPYASQADLNQATIRGRKAPKGINLNLRARPSFDSPLSSPSTPVYSQPLRHKSSFNPPNPPSPKTHSPGHSRLRTLFSKTSCPTLPKPGKPMLKDLGYAEKLGYTSPREPPPVPTLKGKFAATSYRPAIPQPFLSSGSSRPVLEQAPTGLHVKVDHGTSPKRRKRASSTWLRPRAPPPLPGPGLMGVLEERRPSAPEDYRYARKDLFNAPLPPLPILRPASESPKNTAFISAGETQPPRPHLRRNRHSKSKMSLTLNVHGITTPPLVDCASPWSASGGDTPLTPANGYLPQTKRTSGGSASGPSRSSSWAKMNAAAMASTPVLSRWSEDTQSVLTVASKGKTREGVPPPSYKPPSSLMTEKSRTRSPSLTSSVAQSLSLGLQGLGVGLGLGKYMRSRETLLATEDDLDGCGDVTVTPFVADRDGDGGKDRDDALELGRVLTPEEDPFKKGDVRVSTGSGSGSGSGCDGTFGPRWNVSPFGVEPTAPAWREYREVSPTEVCMPPTPVSLDQSKSSRDRTPRRSQTIASSRSGMRSTPTVSTPRAESPLPAVPSPREAALHALERKRSGSPFPFSNGGDADKPMFTNPWDGSKPIEDAAETGTGEESDGEGVGDVEWPLPPRRVFTVLVEGEGVCVDGGAGDGHGRRGSAGWHDVEPGVEYFSPKSSLKLGLQDIQCRHLIRFPKKGSMASEASGSTVMSSGTVGTSSTISAGSISGSTELEIRSSVERPTRSPTSRELSEQQVKAIVEMLRGRGSGSSAVGLGLTLGLNDVSERDEEEFHSARSSYASAVSPTHGPSVQVLRLLDGGAQERVDVMGMKEVRVKTEVRVVATGGWTELMAFLERMGGVVVVCVQARLDVVLREVVNGMVVTISVEPEVGGRGSLDGTIVLTFQVTPPTSFEEIARRCKGGLLGQGVV